MPGDGRPGGSPPAVLETVGRGLTALRAEGGLLWAGRGYEIVRSADGGRTWQTDGIVPVPRRRLWAARSRVLDRVVRGGVSALLHLADGARLAVAAGAVHRAEAGSGTYRTVLRFERGSRPLNLCLDPAGAVFFGEYFLNLRRAHPVRVLTSGDGGRTWDAAWTFPAGAVCHVHRVVHDPWDGSLLVCTGDRDEESAVWRTRDGFRSLERGAGGSQEFRIAALVPVEEGLLFGTDRPSGPNRICLLGRDGAVRPVQTVPGPVLYGCRAAGGAAFSTMAEGPGHEVTLWAGGAAGFSMIARMPAPRRNWLWRELAGYSRMILPDVAGEPDALYVTPVGTGAHDGHLLRVRMSVAE